MDISAIANLGWREVLIAISVVLAIYIVVVFLRFYGAKPNPEEASFPEGVTPQAAISAYAELQKEALEGVGGADNSPTDAPLGFDAALEARLANEDRAAGLAKNKALWYEPPPETDGEDSEDNDRTAVLEREVVIFRKDRKRILALEQEVAQFRKEVGSLRVELMVLREVQQEIEREIEQNIEQKAEREAEQAAERKTNLERQEARLEAERRIDFEAPTKLVRNASPFYNDAMEMAMQGHDSAAISAHCGISLAEAELVVALAKEPS